MTDLNKIENLIDVLREAEMRIVELCQQYNHPFPYATFERIHDAIAEAKTNE